MPQCICRSQRFACMRVLGIKLKSSVLHNKCFCPLISLKILILQVHILLYITKEMSDLISMGGPWVQCSKANNTSQVQVNFISQRMHRLSGLHEEVILPLEGKAFEKLLCCSYPLSFSIDWTHQSYRVWKTKCPILNPGNQPLPGQRVNIWMAGARNKPWLLWKGSVVLASLKRSWSA